MKFNRSRKRPRYVTISSRTVCDPRIGALAFGIIAYRAEQADTYELHDAELMRRWGVGRDQLIKAWAELEAAGYATGDRIRTKRGTFTFERTLREESLTAPPTRQQIAAADAEPFTAAEKKLAAAERRLARRRHKQAG